MRVLFIEQDHVSPPGPIGEAFSERGYDVTELVVVPKESFATPNVPVVFPDPATFDAIVPMGAPWSVYDEASIGNWIGSELEFLRAADSAGVPVLGICFGAQALAATHGGVVSKASEPEIGWYAIESDDHAIVGPGPWFQWHYDCFSAPPEATVLARTTRATQAFTLRRNLGVQFHPELTPAMLVGWLDNGGDRALERAGISVDEVVIRTRAEATDASQRARRLVHSFLDRVATRPLT